MQAKKRRASFERQRGARLIPLGSQNRGRFGVAKILEHICPLHLAGHSRERERGQNRVKFLCVLVSYLTKSSTHLPCFSDT